MVVSLCFANLLSLWMMGAEQRDNLVVSTLKQANYAGQELVINVNNPWYSPVSCPRIYAFLDKWTIPGLKYHNMPTSTMTHGRCGVEACTCTKKTICVL